MRTALFVLVCVLCTRIVSAQYTYFNQITGDPNDLESNSATNVEVVDDGYVVWGGGVDAGVLFQFVRKYSLEGEIINENILLDQNEYVLSGLINTFKWNPLIEKFVYIHGTNLNDGTTEGYMIEFDENLDTTFTRRFDQYPPYTYPFIFTLDEDGYVVSGEYGGQPNTNGTFAMKLDFEGNIVWSEIMQPDIGPIYRNWSIIPMDNGGYLVAGGGFSGGGMNAIEPFGRITLLDSVGNTLSIIDYEDETELGTSPMAAFELTGGEILTAQSIYYEHYSGTTNPNVFWNKIRLQKFDPMSESFYWQQDYHGDYELLLGAPADAVATTDGGAVILGVRKGESEANSMYTWMMKVDVDGNEEWFHEYTYESCETCHNMMWDLEKAPDGGYVMAGYFANYSINPRNSTWLLKVDACGDVEWQGCKPLGIGAAVNPGDRSVVYPNPGSEWVFVEPPVNKTVVSHKLLDMTGKRVAGHGRITASGIDVSALARGLYVLHLTYADGSMESHKVEIAK